MVDELMNHFAKLLSDGALLTAVFRSSTQASPGTSQRPSFTAGALPVFIVVAPTCFAIPLPGEQFKTRIRGMSPDLEKIDFTLW